MKTAFLTCACKKLKYYRFGLDLCQKFKKNDFEVFVLTDNPTLFSDFNVIEYYYGDFSYHYKFFPLEKIYNLGYEKIIFIDADVFIFRENFFKELHKINFGKGISFSRNGLPSNLEQYLTKFNLTQLRNELNILNLESFNEIPSIWEDVIYFNFKNFSPTIFFEFYKKITELKHESDILNDNIEYFGNNEGYTISISCKLTNTGCEINNKLTGLLNTMWLETSLNEFAYMSNFVESEEENMKIYSKYRGKMI